MRDAPGTISGFNDTGGTRQFNNNPIAVNCFVDHRQERT
ncbi:hypothetical protein ABIA20_002510 [Sinorhizobium fredii]